MKWLLLIAAFSATMRAGAQELFSFTEPASNMAANSAAIRTTATFNHLHGTGSYNTYLVPEVMYGVSKKIMVNLDGFFEKDYNGSFAANGGSVYAKYKFLNKDEVKKHFRMAAFGRYAYNRSPIEQEELSLTGFNTGIEGGITATQLLHKTALSAGSGFIKAFDNNKNLIPAGMAGEAMNYTLSWGRLMYPHTYTDYNQTNINIMCELLAQNTLPNGKWYLDIGPTLQFIFKSRARLDLSYRKQLLSSMTRLSAEGFVVKMEYNFYNVF